MKFRIMRWKYGTQSEPVQAQSLRFAGSRITATGLVTASLLITGGAVGQESTSPLAILQQAPKVRLEDPTPRPMQSQPMPSQGMPQQSIPYRPPAGPAPYVEPVYPSLTPYNGNSVTAPRQQPDSFPDYQQPDVAPPAVSAPGTMPGSRVPFSPSGARVPLSARNTPVPVLGPEDVGGKPEKKRGFVRGIINAIPFVGDDEEEARFTPVPTRNIEPPPIAEPPPMEERPFSDDQQVYRGYEPTPSSPRTGTVPGEPLLLPPGSTPVAGRSALPPDPGPSSPPIMTPTPRGGAGTGYSPAMEATGEVDPERPVLTVRREGDETSPSVNIAPSDTTTVDETEKRPSVSGRSEDAPLRSTPRPIAPVDVKTSAVTIEEVPPRALDPEETSPQASDVDRANALSGIAAADDPGTSATIEEAEVTSLTIEQSDLGMPNPTYEQNTVILGEFQDAVRKARAEDYATAAQLFRDYGYNHPSSGLAPRAFYLSAVFEKNKAKARESIAALEKLFPKNSYVKQAKDRRADILAAEAPAAVAVSTETPRQKIDRLEKELTAAVGDPAKEPVLRRQLGEAYLDLEENDRAWEVLSPAVEMSAGTAEEGSILLLLARAHMARGDVTRALAILDTVEQKYPASVVSNVKSAWSAGLAFEAGARYAKARSIYNEIRQKWPDAQEARWAELRLRELAALSQ